ncbi:alkyl hydroperoxide reductase [Methylacidiphilum kamchatkense Kam1]|uniref:thioredoxin-dependent peroxiredoxin n=1 Tax=Methylacidiphilum kamchatkense Kam1 TaxID=1202785 RepID=A0ABR4ZVK3_9BACT|nr:alkyl hydroperoxide reductase [Methylacidiphilum kamchatkense Kam1]
MNQLSALPIGSEVPDVTAVDQDGNLVSLRKVAQNGWVLFYFYPKAETPGCIREAHSLKDNYKQLLDNGIKVYGISMDTVEAQKKFKENHQLPFTLLADPEGKVVDKFGVPKKYGMASRQSFLAKEGKIVWFNLHVNPDGHAQEVLEVVKKIKESS